MGCTNSVAKSFEKFSQTTEFQQWSDDFAALQITKSELLRFYKVFRKVDLDGGGTIDLVEMLTVVDVDRTPFTERVFSIFDDDKSGKIDFREFVLALWNYNTLTRFSLGMFAFDLYDRDSSGLLEEDDLNKMMRDIYGKKASSHYARQVAKDLKDLIDRGREITLEVFLEFSHLRQSLLFPAFEMQFALRKQILGVRYWEQSADRRVKLSNNSKYTTMSKLLEMHASKSMQNVAAGLHSGKAKEVYNATGTLAERRKHAKEKFERYKEQQLQCEEPPMSLAPTTSKSTAPAKHQSHKDSIVPTDSEMKHVDTKPVNHKPTTANNKHHAHKDSVVPVDSQLENIDKNHTNHTFANQHEKNLSKMKAAVHVAGIAVSSTTQVHNVGYDDSGPGLLKSSDQDNKPVRRKSLVPVDSHDLLRKEVIENGHGKSSNNISKQDNIPNRHNKRRQSV